MLDLFMLKALPAIGSFFILRAVIALTKKSEGPDLKATGVIHQGTVGRSGIPMNAHGSPLERLDYWLVKTFNLEEHLDQLHAQLGRPEDMKPLQMLRQKQAFVLGAAFFLYFIIGPGGMILAPLAFFVPDALMNGNIQRRQQQILGDFPQFVDLTALLLESGADYMTAFQKICAQARKKSDLELEIEKVIAECSLGATRKDALRHFANRVGAQEIRSFVGLIIQSEELGTSLVGLLRDFAADMRFRRLQKAEKLAAQAATKMLIPLFVFIFPCVFLMMLGPMAYNMIASGGLF